MQSDLSADSLGSSKDMSWILVRAMSIACQAPIWMLPEKSPLRQHFLRVNDTLKMFCHSNWLSVSAEVLDLLEESQLDRLEEKFEDMTEGIRSLNPNSKPMNPTFYPIRLMPGGLPSWADMALGDPFLMLLQLMQVCPRVSSDPTRLGHFWVSRPPHNFKLRDVNVRRKYLCCSLLNCLRHQFPNPIGMPKNACWPHSLDHWSLSAGHPLPHNTTSELQRRRIWSAWSAYSIHLLS